MTFKELCALRGIELLRDDEKFLKKMKATKKELINYAKIWKYELKEGRSQNQGRFRANTWLRQLRERV